MSENLALESSSVFNARVGPRVVRFIMDRFKRGVYDLGLLNLYEMRPRFRRYVDEKIAEQAAESQQEGFQRRREGTKRLHQPEYSLLSEPQSDQGLSVSNRGSSEDDQVEPE